MDEVKIESRLLRGLVSRLIKHTVKKKLGYDVGINLNRFNVETIDGVVMFHLDIDADMTTQELERILKKQMF